MRYIIGVDLGGTQLRAGLADEDGKLLHEIRIATEAADGPEAVISRIVDCIQRVRAELPDDGALLGVGVGSPGPLDPFRGIVFTQPNMPGWHDVPLRDILSQRTGLPIELGNDANAAALGEWYYGGGQGVRNLVYVTISTGVGGGVIVDGHLLLGRFGSAAEVGHHVIDWTTRASWEDLAAGPGLGRAAAAAMADAPDSLLHTLASPATVTAAHVAQAAAQKDPLALRLLDREGELIGIGLLNMLNMYSPELILVGGGVVINNPQLLERAQQVIQERAFEVFRDVPVRLAALGDQAGLLGAVALIRHMHGTAA